LVPSRYALKVGDIDVLPSTSSMMRRIVRAQRPHCALQPRQS